MLAALVLPVAAVCFAVCLVVVLERPRKRTVSLTERPSRQAVRSVADEAEEWLHKHA